MRSDLVDVADVSNLASALGEARRVRYGLPVLIGGRVYISAFAISAGGGYVFATMSWIALLSSAVAAIILVVFDAANIRGRPVLTRLLLGYIGLSLVALIFDAVHVAGIVLPGLKSGTSLGMSDELGAEGIFVLMFVLGSWLIVALGLRAAKALRAPLEARDRRILAAAPVALPTLRMALRTAITVTVFVVLSFGSLMVSGLLHGVPYKEALAAIRKEGLLNMARELAVGLAHGETAAIGVTVVFVLGVAILLLKLYGALAPRQAPLSRLWRWAKDVRSALAADPRAPVLLLRSFADEGHGTRGRPSDFGASGERAVARSVSGGGPFIAIGAPGEAQPAGRAFRTYLKDDERQQAVVDWVRESQLIVVILGLTKWVGWELDTIRAEGQLGKTLVLVPPTDNPSRAARWALLERACSETPWHDALAAVADRSRVLLLEFKPSGRSGAVRSEQAGRDDYHAAALAALRDPP